MLKGQDWFEILSQFFFLFLHLQQLFPKTYDRIVENDRMGNFLAMITRLGDKSTILKDQFSGSYNMVSDQWEVMSEVRRS